MRGSCGAGSELGGGSGSYNFTFNATRAPAPLLFDTSPGAIQWTSAGLELQLSGLTGHGAVVLYMSTDLASWIPIYTNPPATGSLRYLDPTATNSASRYSRALGSQ